MKKEKRTERLPEPKWKPSEVAKVKKHADKLGISVSAYLRQAALNYVPWHSIETSGNDAVQLLKG